MLKKDAKKIAAVECAICITLTTVIVVCHVSSLQLNLFVFVLLVFRCSCLHLLASHLSILFAYFILQSFILASMEMHERKAHAMKVE